MFVQIHLILPLMHFSSRTMSIAMKSFWVFMALAVVVLCRPVKMVIEAQTCTSHQTHTPPFSPEKKLHTGYREKHEIGVYTASSTHRCPSPLRNAYGYLQLPKRMAGTYPPIAATVLLPCCGAPNGMSYVIRYRKIMV